MGEGALFRNAAVGGFNKEDVLRYIEMMKQSSLENGMQLEQATRQLQDAQRRVQVLETQLEQKTQEASRLAQERQALEERARLAEEQARHLSARVSGYEADKAKLQAVETQIGSLMVSAHMYANRIVSQARQEAERITQQASLAIDQATNHINLLSVDAQSAQGRYQSLFEEVSGKIQTLTASLQEAGEQLQANIRRNVAEAKQALREGAAIPQADAGAGGQAAASAPAQEGAPGSPVAAPCPTEPETIQPGEPAGIGGEAIKQSDSSSPLPTEGVPDPPSQLEGGGIDYSRFVDVIPDDSMFSK